MIAVIIEKRMDDIISSFHQSSTEASTPQARASILRAAPTGRR
jgi:hypothetical protein